MNYKLSDNLNHLMQWKEISQKELASMIGVSAPAVSSWQRGIREIPSSRIDAVCEALGCRRSELLEGHFPPTGKAAPLIIEIAGRLGHQPGSEDRITMSVYVYINQQREQAEKEAIQKIKFL